VLPGGEHHARREGAVHGVLAVITRIVPAADARLDLVAPVEEAKPGVIFVARGVRKLVAVVAHRYRLATALAVEPEQGGFERRAKRVGGDAERCRPPDAGCLDEERALFLKRAEIGNAELLAGVAFERSFGRAFESGGAVFATYDEARRAAGHGGALHAVGQEGRAQLDVGSDDAVARYLGLAVGAARAALIAGAQDERNGETLHCGSVPQTSVLSR
jgi:hypothetical protein